MEAAQQTNGEQATLWNGPAGRAWVEMQALLDAMFEPVENLLVEALPAGAGGRLLDVGCGTGGTTLAFARRLGAGADCLGVDISGPMIGVAQARALREGLPARFVQADAQLHQFEPGCFDRIVSRFGVMFFDHPVQAFSNLRRAAKKGARLDFAAWRSATENPFMTAAERAAAPLLPQLAPRRADGPGQFSFADAHRVTTILQASGWAEIDIRPVDLGCALPEKELLRYLSWLGPVGVLLQQSDQATRTKIIDTVRAAFEPYVFGREVRYTAACWKVSARA